MNSHWRPLAVGTLSALAVCATATFVLAAAKKKGPAPAAAQTSKPMSIEEARRIAAQTQNFTRPPRTIDDIANILGQHKPDPAKIKKLQETADKKAPPNLKGMALADFLFERGSAARDLGRTQQRLADMREAHKLSKSHALWRRPIWIGDFPTPSNPMGSAAFQAFVNAKRAAKMAAGPGPGRGNIDTSSMTPQERQRFLARQAANQAAGGRPGVQGGPGHGWQNQPRLHAEVAGGIKGALPGPGLV